MISALFTKPSFNRLFTGSSTVEKESINLNGFMPNCKIDTMTLTPIPSIDAVALFMLGFLGTGHCIGMCGPLVVAFPGQTRRFSAHLCYHMGRVLTYAVIGAIMGAAGSGVVRLAASIGGDPLVWVTRCQVGISLLAGLFLLFLGLSRLGFATEPEWLAVATPSRIPGWRRLMTLPAANRSNRDLFFVGLMLGGLPCGLSYAAFATSLAAANTLAGAAAALIFGLGTLPGLLAIGAGAGVVLRRYRQQADLLAGLIMIGMAAMLLVKAWEVITG